MRPDPTSIEAGALRFHAKRLNQSEDEVLGMWEKYPDAKIVWPEFTKFLSEHHTRQDRQSMFTAPIAAGANIIKFDIPIVERYNFNYGIKTDNQPKPLFNNRDKIDLLNWFFIWFENNKDIESYSMDAIREYLGMSSTNAHDALQDVRDCAEIIIRFMGLHRRTAAKVKFKGAFK